MKKAIALMLLPLCLVACGGGSDKNAGEGTGEKSTAAATQNEAGKNEATSATAAPKKYTVKSGIIEMTTDMMGEQKQTIYFDDYGAREATYTTISMEMMGQKINSSSVKIDADGWTSEFDPDAKTGKKYRSIGMPAGGAPTMNFSELTDKMKEDYKYKELETKQIAGKEAKGMSMEMSGMKMKTWVWEGIPLYSEVDMGMKKPMILKVTSLQTDVPVPADKFTVPADIQLQDVSVATAPTTP